MSYSSKEPGSLVNNLHWLGHSSFRLDGDQTIYIDPFKIVSGKVADIILVSHAHYDHCSRTSIERIMGKGTLIIASRACAGVLRLGTRFIEPGESLTVLATTVEAVPAYSIGREYHPRSEGGLGFVISTGGRRFYFAGDTDLIPEMAGISADVAILPVSGLYVMSAEEAANAVRLIRPSVAVPMHYGTVVGRLGDALRFKELSSVPVAILEKE